VQEPGAFQTGGRGYAEPLGEGAVGLPAICLQMVHDRRIKFIHDWLMRQDTEFHSVVDHPSCAST
jgi:hypothetical protein